MNQCHYLAGVGEKGAAVMLCAQLRKKAPSVYMIDILMCGIWWQQSAEAVVSGLQIIQSSNQAMHQSKLTYVQVTFQSITFIKRAV